MHFNLTDEGMKDRQSALKEYYARYLRSVRSLKDSSINHYFDALKYISKWLKEKSLVQQDIYEIKDIEQLNTVREILYADAEFIELNERGKRMYSAGLNNYCRFAAGEGFSEIRTEMQVFDAPVPPDDSTVVQHSIWRRSGIIKTQALELAGYSCELNADHQSFIADRTQKPYMEGHHALPMSIQDRFSAGLDVYANIICLCPICHRRIHYGLKDDRKEMVQQVYEMRGKRLANSGIQLSKDEFIGLVLESQ